jgi:hypothetical protein
VDINVGFGKVLRVRWLKASPARKHLFRPKVVLRSLLQVNHDKVLELLERRKLMRQEGLDITAITREIEDYGYAVEDELTRGDFAYSYWRRR